MMRDARQRPAWSSFKLWLPLSLGLMLLLALPMIAVLLPMVHERRMLNRLASDDVALREKALNFVLREAPSDPGLRQAATDRLASLPARPALELYNAFHALQQSGDPAVLAALTTASTRFAHDDFLLAMQELVNKRQVGYEPMVDVAVARLASADDAQFAGLFITIDAHQRWRRERVGDASWLRWIALRAVSGEPTVRQSSAMLLAERFEDEPMPAPLVALLRDADPSVRSIAWFAAAPRFAQQSKSLSHIAELRSLPGVAPMTTAQQRTIDAVMELLENKRFSDPSDAPPSVAEADVMLTLLRALETASPGSMQIAGDAVAGWPALQRVLAVRSAAQPMPGWLDDAWVHEDPAVRDLACLFASQRFDASTLDALVTTLLNDLNDEMKMCGAVLAGLSGRRLELLAERAPREDTEAVRLIMRLVLWSAGCDDAMSAMVPALLEREGFPATTTLLLMLHHGDDRALRSLLGPEGLDDAELANVLLARRFLWVLRILRPDAPRVDAWSGDPVDAQLARLRAWYWVQRWQLVQAHRPGYDLTP